MHAPDPRAAAQESIDQDEAKIEPNQTQEIQAKVKDI